jgi:hypothetical protein
MLMAVIEFMSGTGREFAVLVFAAIASEHLSRKLHTKAKVRRHAMPANHKRTVHRRKVMPDPLDEPVFTILYWIAVLVLVSIVSTVWG